MRKSNSKIRPTFSEQEIDYAYLAGVFNVSGIDGLQKEIERLKRLRVLPRDIILAARGVGTRDKRELWLYEQLMNGR